MLHFLYPLSLFLSAFLLFSIQPMAAKALLPIYGGTPAVWTVCMLFFQSVLVLAYGYVCLLNFSRKSWIWRLIHTFLLLISLLALPFAFHPVPMGGLPESDILLTLLRTFGIPLFLLGASAPLLQFAYSQTAAKSAADPYFLYIASNFGSLIALLGYPWLVERFFGLGQQFHLWGIGYVLYALVLLLILYTTTYQTLEKTSVSAQNTLMSSDKSMLWEVLYWIFLSFVPCSLMLGLTLYITTDVAATPLFWILPLALYLLSFMLTFTTKPFISQDFILRNLMFFLVFCLLGFILGVSQVKIWQLILFNLLSFMMLALLCHGQLFQRRPNPRRLPLFYFSLALGGGLAGIFNGLIAPHLFSQIYEYPLAIALAILVLPIPLTRREWWLPALIIGLLTLPAFIPSVHWPMMLSNRQVSAILCVIALTFWQKNKIALFLSLLILFIFLFSGVFRDQTVLVQARNFYGVKQVFEMSGVHVFMSQSTIHGLQLANEKKPINGFTSYYGPLKDVMKLLHAENSSLSVTIMGLGMGTMRCQFHPNDRVNLVEIDPQVIAMAKNPNLFSYFRDCPLQDRIIQSDGRLALANLPDASQDLLILDAFISDSVPVHLMTLDAFKLYEKKLKPTGVILVNISNRHLALLPVLNAISRSLELILLHRVDKGEPQLGQLNSEWAILTQNEPFALQLISESPWRFVTEDKQFLWTDEYSNLLPLLKF